MLGFFTRGMGADRRAVPVSIKAKVDRRLPLAMQKMLLLQDVDRMKAWVEKRMDLAEKRYGDRYYSDDSIAVINGYFARHDSRDDRKVSFDDIYSERADWQDAVRILDTYYPETR